MSGERGSTVYSTHTEHRDLCAYHFLCVPVKHIVIVVAKFVEEVSEELPEVRVVWTIFKLQRPTEIEVRGKFTWRVVYMYIIHTVTGSPQGV